ncbi:hypothetical protein AT3G24929 [Arabidopsis thaliana]|uniref:Uncharacterized protein n=1 Tax=Arabidopsis thaliana TaxID=3702 RepID=F4J7T8_ARATH|nr:uncharacterized protein AT3G24929 [Arabidopsis thaliana]NP_001327172.1 uncharacterized protein AT3G24929 [Arabidopsis thaliana]NP_001327175.1 uncharacterized protein AT3G24929 [Arabidopsis thaliana]AEE76962.2 hypothetical protein AT3G24929 [Arabidopsis thaliana]ANM65183.1 hypothetical protein AT3G24929 [Arabidopsis thaliana]ANM65186.1 hypothetical protein AT3G24929 [Arabidopsis thaliana]|eukprot:NP_001319638.1 hypothetical protein AT3G24929 [Arabidopsis thaliana]
MASPIALLQQIPMAFNKRYGGGKEWLQLTKRPKSKVFLWRTLRRRPKGIVEICPRDAYQLTKKQEGIIKSIHMIVRDRGKFIMELYLKKSGKVEKGIKID